MKMKEELKLPVKRRSGKNNLRTKLIGIAKQYLSDKHLPPERLRSVCSRDMG